MDAADRWLRKNDPTLPARTDKRRPEPVKKYKKTRRGKRGGVGR